MSRRWLAVGAAVIWAATFLCYSNSFKNSFQFDDLHTVQSNVYIRSLSYVPRYFADATTYSYRPENSGYRPMASLACAIGFQLSHLVTWGYHLIKVLEHCLVALLIMLVSLKLLPRRGSIAEVPGARALVAFFAALLFAVHRANTETVDYITAISSMQAGLFDLLAFYLYLRFRESSVDAPVGRLRYVFAALAVVCYEASMMSKEEGVTLPAVIFLYEWIYGRKVDEGYLDCLRRNWKIWALRLAPYVAAAVLFITLRTCIQPAVADTSRGNIPRFVYFITQFRSWLHYWSLFFWPVTLNADNLAFEFSHDLTDLRVWGALAVHVAIWFGAWRIGRRRRFVLFAVAWAYVTILPASSVFPLVEAVNEHRMYIPYMMLAPLATYGLFFACLWAARAIGNAPAVGRTAAILLCTAAAVGLGSGAYARNEVWRTEVSLWEDVYSKNPDSPRALNVLGVSLLTDKQYERGLPLLERCHALAPGYLPCMVHLGMAYAHYRRYDDGLKVLLYGHHLNPDYPHLNFHLGIYYKDYLGHESEAIPYFQRVVDLTEGRFFQATLKLAEIRLDQSNYAEATRLTQSVLQLDRTNGDAWAILGRAKLLSGQAEAAGKIFAQIVRAAPEAHRYLFDFANWAERTGDYQTALASYRSVATRNQNAIQAFTGMARVARKLHDETTARQADFSVEALKRGGNWEFTTSLGLIGEKPGQVAP